MASTRERFTKDGKRFFEIRVSRGRGKQYLSQTWWPPQGWSEKMIQRKLQKVADELDEQVHAGKVISKQEQRQQDMDRAAAEAAEREKIQTVEQFAKVFMKKVALERSENTRQNYQSLIDKHIVPAIGALPIEDVTSAEVDNLLTDMLAGKRKYKLSTRQRTWTVLNLLFKAAKRQRLIRYSPMDDLEGERPTATKAEKAAAERKKDMFLDADAVKAVLAAFDDEEL
ncbi:MAG: hypothetical protein IJT99_04170 [Clostridia bacterium]|nr:hypothetical protein [Clostridia bacterium]